MVLNNTSPDVILILGGGISTDGVLTPVSKSRMDMFLQVKDRFLSTPIIVSGRHALFQKYHPSRTEAQSMKEYLVVSGISKKLITLEDASLDTVGNAFYTKKIITARQDWKNILLVTSDWHMRRSLWIFHKIYGINFQIMELAVTSTNTKEIMEHKTKSEAILLTITKALLMNGNVWVRISRIISSLGTF